MILPADFIRQMEAMMPSGLWHDLQEGLAQEPAVSIRINPSKIKMEEWEIPLADGRVPWCEYGFYLSSRPAFTFDPLLHAGAYYVQDASSMFLHHVLCELFRGERREERGERNALRVLDLCAAPGGKSTLARSILPEDCLLVSNEPIRSRYQVLEENVTKWGYDRHEVTNLYPRDFRKRKELYDIIIADVPCSGEGMFRKDETAIKEWSLQKVEQCQQLQRDIVGDAWECLRPGGILVYSTCTFNTKENEENIKWIVDNYDAEVLPIPVEPEWNIQGSILPDFIAPVYRFLPGITRGEGLFMAVVQKRGERREERLRVGEQSSGMRGERNALTNKKNRVAQNKSLSSLLIPEQSSPTRSLSPLSSINLDYSTAISYLRGEALRLPEDTPRGEVTVCFEGHPLGLVKNIGTRANNLYPKAWRIKSTHIPEYEAILKRI